MSFRAATLDRCYHVLGQRAAAGVILLDVAPFVPIVAFQHQPSIEPLRILTADALGIFRLSHRAIEVVGRVPLLAGDRRDQPDELANRPKVADMHEAVIAAGGIRAEPAEPLSKIAGIVAVAVLEPARRNVFRFTLELGHYSMPSACLKGARTRPFWMAIAII
jgi:hypothetical protein